MSNSALKENFNFYFSVVFCYYQQNFILGERLGTISYNSMMF